MSSPSPCFTLAAVRLSLLLLLFACGGFLAASSKPDPEAAQGWQIEDQFGGKVSLGDHKGEVTLVTVVNFSGLRRSRTWLRELAKRFPDQPILRIVTISPKADPERAFALLRKRVPVPMGVDKKQLWSSAFDLDSKELSLLLFTREGKLHSIQTGKYSEARIEKLAGALQALTALPD